MKVFIVGVDYKEFDGDSYNGVILRHSGEQIKKIDSGEFPKDLQEMKDWIDKEYESENYILTKSSSLDSYLIDTDHDLF